MFERDTLYIGGTHEKPSSGDMIDVYSPFTEERVAKGQTGAYLAGLDKVRFRKAVFPDDVLRLEVTIQKMRSKIIIFAGEASVGGSKVAEAEIMVSLY